MTNTLYQHASEQGIALDYYDVEGGHHRISDDILRYFIQLLDNDLSLPDETDSTCFDDVFVITCDSDNTLSLTDSIVSYQLVDESQQLLTEDTFSSPVNTLTLSPLSLGYYTLILNTLEQEQKRYRLIAAPSHCYQPPEMAQRQLRGLNLQLYSLRSSTHSGATNAATNAANDAANNHSKKQQPLNGHRDNQNKQGNWGIGDFADLADAISAVGAYGLDFVGINPLHALYPAQPQWASPYSPSSRQWQHWLYLSLAWVPEFCHSTAAQQWLTSQQARIQALRDAETVDYTVVTQLKMQALQLAFAEFETSIQPDLQSRRDDFARFVETGGESLQLDSAFHVLNQKLTAFNPKNDATRHNVGWVNWTTAYQNPKHPYVQQFITENSSNIRFYSYLQWLIDEQLTRLQKTCDEHGLSLGLYGDLAVGTARGSAEVWRNPDLYFVNASIGAPPDPLGPVGQDWQLPPINPKALKKVGFQPWIELLRANMKHCGALRIDHVMGLYRLWLIPEGKTAADGAYVHYPFETLMAITAVESQRARCLVIGEDLGTVPNEVGETLRRYRILSYDVLYFSGVRQYRTDYTRWRPPAEAKTEALSVIGTHDLPPLRGWWHCHDLDTLADLGILQGEALQQKYDARLHDKQALLNALQADGFLPEDYHIDALTMSMHPQLNHAIHAYALAGGARLFGIQPENFCNMETAFNVPGTIDEVPNWRRKLPEPVSDILARLPIDLYAATKKIEQPPNDS